MPSNTCSSYKGFGVATIIILIHELLERFSFYGTKGILTMYLHTYMGLSEDVSTTIYHAFTALSYLLTIVGAVIADNFWGRYKTIFVFGAIYAVGHIMTSLTSIKPNIAGAMISITVLGIGSGAIKPCVGAFGADQVKGGEEVGVNAFFSMFYLAINIGAFLGQLITPILRADVQCGDGGCYPVAFGVPAIAFILTYVLFFAGTRFYDIKQQTNNTLLKVVSCTKYAFHQHIRRWRQQVDIPKKDHILDYAEDRYEKSFIADIKVAFGVIAIFAPFPLFWALYDQQGSRWTLQAARMNGRISKSVTILPSQMQTINAFLLLFMIPLFSNVIYPLLSKCNMLTTPKSRLVGGYCFAAASFIAAAIMEIQLKSVPMIPSGANVAQMRVMYLKPANIPSGEDLKVINEYLKCNSELVILNSTKYQSIDRTRDISCCFGYDYIDNSGGNKTKEDCIQLGKLSASNKYTLIISRHRTAGNTSLEIMSLPYSAYYDVGENTAVVNLVSCISHSGTFSAYSKTRRDKPFLIPTGTMNPLKPGTYEFRCQGCGGEENKSTPLCAQSDITFDATKIYTLVVADDKGCMILSENSINTLSMLWQLPQYILMTSGEVLSSITALSFAYNEAPGSMKTLLNSAYLLTVFGGNLLVAFIALLPKVGQQEWEFVIFAVFVMIAGMINYVIFIWYDNRKVECALMEDVPLQLDEQENAEMSNKDSEKAMSA